MVGGSRVWLLYGAAAAVTGARFRKDPFSLSGWFGKGPSELFQLLYQHLLYTVSIAQDIF